MLPNLGLGPTSHLNQHLSSQIYLRWSCLRNWGIDHPQTREYCPQSHQSLNQTIEFLRTGINHLDLNSRQNPSQIPMLIHQYNRLPVQDNLVQYLGKHLCHLSLHHRRYLFAKSSNQIHLALLDLEYFHMNLDNHKFRLSRYLSLFVLGYIHWNRQDLLGKLRGIHHLHRLLHLSLNQLDLTHIHQD